MATCPFCEREMLNADSCTKDVLIIDGDEYEPIPFGEEADWPTNDRCHDCGVEPGGYHHPGCDVERIPEDARDEIDGYDGDQLLWLDLGGGVEHARLADTTLTDPENCDHEDRQYVGVDSEGLPDALYAEYDCRDCNSRISRVFEPTPERLVTPEGGEPFEETVGDDDA